jgi:hypothetical protein
VECGWVGWATQRTIPLCGGMELHQDGLIAGGVWLALGLIVLLAAPTVRWRAVGR